LCQSHPKYNAKYSLVNKFVREEKFYNIDGEDGLIKGLMKEMPVNTYKTKR